MATKVVSSIPASVSPTHSDSPSTSSSSPKSKLEGEALISALRQQLDFYFSKENLTSDTYLLSHMNVSRSVPLSLISQFPKVRALTEDRDILLQAIKTCKNCQPDSNGTFVKSTAKVERTTLILRDLPLTIPVSAVLAVFNGSDSPAAGHVRDVKADVEDTWYVTLDSEEVTTATAEWILFSSPSVDGHPLRARVKSENLLRGFYNVPASSNPASTTTATNDSTRNPGSAGWRAPHSHTSESSSSPNSTSSNSAPIINMNGHVSNQFAFGFPQQSGYFGAYPMFQNAQAPFPINAAFGPNAVNFNKFANSNAAASSSPRAGKGGPNPKKGKKIIPNTSTISNQSAGSSSSSTSSSLSSSTSSTVPSDASNVEVDENLSNSPRRNKKKGTAGPNSVSAPQSTRRLPLSDANLLGPEHFPALPIAGPPPSSSGRSGYTKPFKHYTREEMASVVESMDGQLSKPAIGNANVVIRDEPLDRPSILDPLPVIYPASPSPLLAAQPYHSSDLPFLDLNVPPPFLMPNMMPNFNAQQQQQLDQHKKGLATAAAKGSRSIFSSSSSASNTSISSSSSSSSTSQNKATRSPASKPRSAKEHDVAPSSSASTSTTSTASSSSVPASSTSKPTAAAIVAAAAAKGPVQPTSSATISSKPQSTKPSANTKGTKSKDGEKTAPSSSSDSKSAEPSKVSVSNSSSASSSSSSVGAASSVSSSPATPAAPAAPSKPSFAAALGSMSPAEAAAKAKAIEDARKAKLKAKQEEEDAKKKSNSDNNNNSKEGEEVENSKRFERPPKDKESSGSGYKNRRKYGNHHGKSRRGENDENHPSAHNQQNTNQSDSQNSNSNEDRKPTYADLIKKAAAPSSKSAPSSSSHSQSPSPTSSPPSEIGIAESK